MYIFLLILNYIQTLKIHKTRFCIKTSRKIYSKLKNKVFEDDAVMTGGTPLTFCTFIQIQRKKKLVHKFYSTREVLTQESTHNPQLPRIYTINREPKASCDPKRPRRP